MAWVVVGGAAIVGAASLASAYISSNAAKDAAETQSEAASEGIDETRRQFEEMQELMAPWVSQGTEALGQLGQYEQAGSDALSRQRALMGLDGADAQRAAIEGISGSPEMMAMSQQGENAMLQSAAATGGLRGGNTQGALAQFRPQVLSQLINQQYGKLGGLIDMGQGITMNRASLGQASAAGTGAAGMQSASSISGLLQQQGQAAAAAQLASGQAYANVPGAMVQGGMLGYGIMNPGAF
jgi:hypothetical protein